MNDMPRVRISPTFPLPVHSTNMMIIMKLKKKKASSIWYTDRPMVLHVYISLKNLARRGRTRVQVSQRPYFLFYFRRKALK